MKLAILLMVSVLLFAGCTTAPQAPPKEAEKPAPPAPPKNETPLSCSEYCLTLPHPQCEGEWKISGTYPSCVCNYECKTQPPPPVVNETPQPPPEPLATPTTKSVSEMMGDGLAKVKDEFYRSNDGSFNEKTYTWLRHPPPQGGIVFDEGPYTDVTFDDESISSIQASGFVVFDDKASTFEKAYGVAIFKAKSTPLDSYTGSDAFDIYYFPQMIEAELKDCWAYTKDYNINPAQEWFVTYFFRCEKVIEK